MTVWKDLEQHKDAIRAIHEASFMEGVREALSMAMAYEEMNGFEK